MTANQLAYWRNQEEMRHNRVSERETYRHNYRDEDIRNQSNAITLSLGQQERDISRYRADTERYNADTNRINAQTNAQNAATNYYNAETNRLNYGINAYNAETNRLNYGVNEYNAETNRLNWEVNRYNAETNLYNAETSRRAQEATAGHYVNQDIIGFKNQSAQQTYWEDMARINAQNADTKLWEWQTEDAYKRGMEAVAWYNAKTDRNRKNTQNQVDWFNAGTGAVKAAGQTAGAVLPLFM